MKPYILFIATALAASACAPTALTTREASRAVPAAYASAAPADSASSARQSWRTFFPDPNLQGLIDSALVRNQELNITRQEIELARQEIRARRGEYLPTAIIGARAGVERPGRYTLQGATEEAINVEPDRRTPDPLTDYQVGAWASWEVDVWGRLRTARQAAATRYLASVEGRNFAQTNLVAEIANSYYELLALDAQLGIVKQNLDLQRNALDVARLEKASARVTELAVQRFAAQVQNTTAEQFRLQQRITETENRLNLLAGRFAGAPVARGGSASFTDLALPAVRAGQPAQLLANRPDIRQAEQRLLAAKLDVRVARASFYPSLRLTGGAGFGAYVPRLLFTTPQSLLYSLGGDLLAPLVNRNGIQSVYASAGATQLQAVYSYERTVRMAYGEVANQLANLQNLGQSYQAKQREVAALTQSVDISNSLFKAARADYTEVLLTQRDALEARMDLVENKLQQFQATVNVYRALGGGAN